MTLSDGDVITVICLGTTVSQAQQDLKNPVEIVQENGKLMKRYKVTLMNLFDAFDWDCDGYLNLREMDAYTIMSGDEDGVKEDEWNMLKSEFDFAEEKMTIKGFIHMHEAEASSLTEDQSTLDDIWSSLERLGYNKQLRLVHEMKDRVFRLQIDEEHNVKWNFVCGTKSFKLDETEYMLIVSYTATEAEHSVLFKLVDDNEQIVS
ncbi:hypothetical protein WR25_19653 [Diploscapter pachys]|uniref:EF-hand domain-containing protein n=1 Tax=Diploscapter pachys TaxID=2018661 RepID=A0A2A2LTW3_9BILA|nr:hypothetical protein WR25_19653 [Diploscapter pachys]